MGLNKKAPGLNKKAAEPLPLDLSVPAPPPLALLDLLPAALALACPALIPALIAQVALVLLLAPAGALLPHVLPLPLVERRDLLRAQAGALPPLLGALPLLLPLLLLLLLLLPPLLTVRRTPRGRGARPPGASLLLRRLPGASPRRR